MNSSISINLITLGKLLKIYKISSRVTHEFVKVAKKNLEPGLALIALLEKLNLKIKFLIVISSYEIFIYIV